jgi:uncharacterized protein (TIGR03663 family)
MSRAERWLWAALLAVNVVTHSVRLEDRAASHDESMHAFYSYELATRGQYVHDPMMHGPLLFHATAAVFLLLGDSDTTARLLPALFGVALVPVLWLFRRHVGRAGALLAAFLVTISPSLLFYGRFLWSDLFVVVAGLLWMHGALRYLDTRGFRHLVLVAGAMSVAFCSKETAFLTGLSFGSFFAARAAWRVIRGRERLRESPSGHLAVVMLTLVLPFLVAFVHVAVGWNPADFDTPAARTRAVSLSLAAFAVSALVAWAWSLRAGPLGLRFRAWLWLAAVFWALPLPLFTSFFTNVPRGVTTGIVGSLGYWLGQHEVARGGQPWFYYLMLSVLYEPLALLAALAGCVLLAWARVRRQAGHVVPLLAWWVVSSFVAYSWAGEKMPWLLVNLALPMALLGGWSLSRLRVATGPPVGPRAVALLALPALLAGAAVPLLGMHPSGRSLEAAADAVRVVTQVLAMAAVGVMGWRVARPLSRRQGTALLALGGALVLAAYTFRAALQLCFVNQDLASELLVYAHGTPDLKRALAEVREIAARTGDRDALEVAYDDDSTWPLNWYLRGFHKQRYLGELVAPPQVLAPVVMIGSKNIASAEPHLERDYVRRDYRLIWWPPEDYMRSGPRDLLRALRDPARRQRLWRYLLLRETGYERTDWPLRHDFTMFVRRDLAERAWPLGLEARTSPSAAPLPRFECLAQKVIDGPFDGRMLQSPAAVAVGADGRRLIADTGGHRIVVLDGDDAFVRAFGSRCELAKGAAGDCVDPDGPGPRQPGDGQLLEPWGVAEGPDGGTLVADTWNGRVVSFDARGLFVRSWERLSTDAAGTEGLYGPRGIAYHAPQRLVAVSDTGHKRILLYWPDGALRREHGGPGKEAGRFDEPVGVAFGPDGSLYVADAWNRRIQRFDAAFQGTGEWPASGWGSHAPSDKPYVAVSRSGVVYASDPAGARVLVYSPDGRLSATIDGPGWSAPVRVRPAGLAVDDARGLLLVADSARGRVWSLAVSDTPDRPCGGR